jgi:hypothetical protein
MDKQVTMEAVCRPSEGVVARDIQGELIIVPIKSGIGSLEDDIFSLNETGRAIWDRLDGKKTLKEIKDELAKDYEASPSEIEKDILGIAEELLQKGILDQIR